MTSTVLKPEIRKQVEALRQAGNSYEKIMAITGLSKAAVAWHASEKVRASFRRYRQKNRKALIQRLRDSLGNKCSICGYDKCQKALHFHHVDPKSKRTITVGNRVNRGVASMVHTKSYAAAKREVKKCILVCANCHAELHTA